MLVLRIIFIILTAFGGQEKNSVSIYRVTRAHELEIYARNKNFYPVTLEIDFDMQNLKPSVFLPHREVLEPGDDRHLFDLRIIDSSENWKYTAKQKFYMGSIHANHNDSYAYRLPFEKDKKFRLSQGFEGAFSHKGDLRYSLDFDMDEGTKVFAAREGRVVDLKEDFDRGGTLRQFMDYANFVTIIHDDGTFSDYSHLQQNGVIPKIGDTVDRGELIGYSGATGYASGPHLHFVVKKTKRGGGFVSIPVMFETKNGVQFLVEGEEYMSLD